VAEEAASEGRIPSLAAAPAFWLVDPVDGTKEFVGRTGEWTVNIGLVIRGQARFGLILAPVTGELYGGSWGGEAWRQIGNGPRVSISTRKPPREGVTVIVSRRHGDDEKIEALLAGRPVADRITAGSSLKFCRIAEGQADIYPRYGPTSEWDTCAGQAILQAAGGAVVVADTGKPLGYAKRADFLNPPFIAWGMRPGR
jgi:3'(2'), 5'-bisphosphate nucleotidase